LGYHITGSFPSGEKGSMNIDIIQPLDTVERVAEKDSQISDQKSATSSLTQKQCSSPQYLTGKNINERNIRIQDKKSTGRRDNGINSSKMTNSLAERLLNRVLGRHVTLDTNDLKIAWF
jgi:hypothetical protein